jgi:hypothetical protein
MDPWKGQRIGEEANDANAVDEVWRSWIAKNRGYLGWSTEYRDATITTIYMCLLNLKYVSLTT